MCPENRRLVKGGDKKTAELVLEQPSEGRDPGRSGRILTVTGEAICGRLVRQEYLLMRIVCGRSIRCMYKHEAEWYRAEHGRD